MDDDEIVNKRVRRIAKDHGCSVADVNTALDHHPIDRDTFPKRTLAIELVELDKLHAAFREKAIVDRDVAAGAFLVKVAERRATLLGLNPPQAHAVQIIQHEPAAAQTSTEKIRGAIDSIRGIAPPKQPGTEDSRRPPRLPHDLGRSSLLHSVSRPSTFRHWSQASRRGRRIQVYRGPGFKRA